MQKLSMSSVYFLVTFLALLNFNQADTTDVVDKVKQDYRKAEQLESTFPDSAIFYYQRGLIQIAGQKSSSFGRRFSDSLNLLKIDMLTKIGRIFHQQSKYAFASDYYRQALNTAKTVDNDSILGETYFSMAELALENGGKQVAIDYYKKALELWEDIGFIDGIFWAQIGLGINYRDAGNTKRAKFYYEQARELGVRHKNESYIGICSNNLGNLYRQIGDYENAIHNLKIALQSFTKLKNKRYRSDCLHSIGTVYLEYGDTQQAIEYFRQSAAIADSLHDNYRLLGLYANLGSAYSSLDEKDQALLYFSKTLELAQAIGDKARLSAIELTLSDFYRKQNDYENTRTHLNRSLLISKEIGDSVNLAIGLTALAKLNSGRGELLPAIKHARDAFEIARRKGLLKTKIEASACLSKFFEQQKNYKLAYQYAQISHNAKDSLLNAEKIKILEETQAKFDLQQVASEKLLAENKALLSDKKLRERNFLIAGLLITLMIILIIFGRYLYKRLREKKEQKERSAQLTKKIDLLNNQLNARNRELTSKAMIISQNNKVIGEISEVIEHCLKSPEDGKTELHKLRRKLRNIVQESSWNDFIRHFQEVHPGFYKTLSEKYPGLTANEQKICAFLRMNLNSKDIAQITGQSVKSIEVARTRIRKKLDIPHGVNLYALIQKI